MLDSRDLCFLNTDDLADMILMDLLVPYQFQGLDFWFKQDNDGKDSVSSISYCIVLYKKSVQKL